MYLVKRHDAPAWVKCKDDLLWNGGGLRYITFMCPCAAILLIWLILRKLLKAHWFFMHVFARLAFIAA